MRSGRLLATSQRYGRSLSLKEGPDEVTHTILARGDNNISKAESNAERGRDQGGGSSGDGLASVLRNIRAARRRLEARHP